MYVNINDLEPLPLAVRRSLKNKLNLLCSRRRLSFVSAETPNIRELVLNFEHKGNLVDTDTGIRFVDHAIVVDQAISHILKDYLYHVVGNTDTTIQIKVVVDVNS